LNLFAQEPDTQRISIHQLENRIYSGTTPENYIEKENSIAVPSKLNSTGTRNITKMVLGWHPYWVSSTAHTLYDYEVLSHIAYFSYEVDTATGGYISLHDWNTTPIIDYAHLRGVKVLLTVTNFGSSSNTKILSDTVKQKVMINSLITLLKARNGDGINFDFEIVALSQRTNLVNFMKRASGMIKAVIPSAELSLAAPAVDWSGSWDLGSLSQFCDYIIIMGYDYYWKGSTTAGPVAPLEGETYNVTRSVNNYLNNGVPPEKLFLAVPWYGYDWPVVNNYRKAAATGNATARVYSAAANMAETNTRIFDFSTKVPWLSYSSSSVNRQLWYDDPESLEMKFNLVKSKALGGVGIWALSYEGGRREIWDKFFSAFHPTEETFNKIINIYPNPVKGSSAINLFMVNKEFCTLKIYDTYGREIAILISNELDAGFHSQELNMSQFNAGIYICIFQTKSSKSTRKIVVTK
jgi:spore germination protein